MAISAKATQEFVPIKEVRDGIVVLKDGGLRAIVLASSINLSLKSDDEQKATILQFQSFLNTLEFYIQIAIESRRLDIRPYILQLENRMKVQTEPLLKLQTKEYMDFIASFTESVAIMTKHFFIVVPYTEESLRAESGGVLGGLLGGRKKSKEAKAAEELDFEQKKSQLLERVAVIQQGLSRCGINSAQLGTEEVVEAFYKVFNPGELEGKIRVE